MPTQQRRRRRVDVERMGDAVSRPGIDPRTWGSSARIDNDPEALNFLPENGWVVDVTFHGSALDGESETPARVLNIGPPGDGYGEYIPPDPDCEAAVIVPGGDPENGVVLLGYLSNSDGCKPPEEINGLSINPDAEASSDAQVSPFDTEFKRSPHNRREQYDGRRYIQTGARHDFEVAAEYVITSDDIRLGSEGVTEPALLGQTTIDNTNELIEALNQLGSSLAGLTGPLAPLQAIGTALVAAMTALTPKIPQQAAQKVKLE